MTVATIRCSRCQKDLTVIESDEGAIVFVEPCPTCLQEQYELGLDDADSEWETVEEAAWDDEDEDDEEWEEDDDDEDEDDGFYYA